MPHAALWVVQPPRSRVTARPRRSFNAARGFVGGAASNISPAYSPVKGFNAARGFVGGAAPLPPGAGKRQPVSMPHAALWVVQPIDAHRLWICRSPVSMPHAALWVVQPHRAQQSGTRPCFNAARGFVGGAAAPLSPIHISDDVFQCRTRLCGWCSLVARSPFPPREKKPFWKVSGNLRCLTENM